MSEQEKIVKIAKINPSSIRPDCMGKIPKDKNGKSLTESTSELEVLIAIEFPNSDDTKIHKYCFFKDSFEKNEWNNFKNDMFEIWKNKRIRFLNPHSHYIWDLSQSTIMPSYFRQSNDEYCDRQVKSSAHTVLSTKIKDLIEKKLNYLYKRVWESGECSKELNDKAKYYKELINKANKDYREKIGSMELVDLFTMSKFNENEAETEYLIPPHAKQLREKLNKIFEGLKKNRENLWNKNYSIIKPKVDKCTEMSKNSTDWKITRDYFKEVQNELKGLFLNKEQKDELFQKLNGAFETLKNRQEETAKSNYDSLKAKIDKCRQLSKESTDWKNTRQHFKDVQGELKQSYMKKEQKDDLFPKLKEAFETLKNRQEETAKSNYDSLKVKVDRCIHLSNESTDWKETRNYFKEVQGELKQSYMQKAQKDELFEKLNSAFQRLGERQTAEREKQQKRKEENKNKGERLCQQARDKASYSSDLQQAKNGIKTWKQELFNLKPMDKEVKNRLVEHIKESLSIVFERINQEKKQKLENALQKKQDQYYNIEDSLKKDERMLYELEEKYRNIKPGKREMEIKDNIKSKIRNVEDRMSSKRKKLGDIKDSIIDIRSKL